MSSSGTTVRIALSQAIYPVKDLYSSAGVLRRGKRPVSVGEKYQEARLLYMCYDIGYINNLVFGTAAAQNLKVFSIKACVIFYSGFSSRTFSNWLSIADAELARVKEDRKVLDPG